MIKTPAKAQANTVYKIVNLSKFSAWYNDREDIIGSLCLIPKDNLYAYLENTSAYSGELVFFTTPDTIIQKRMSVFEWRLEPVSKRQAKYFRRLIADYE